MLPILRASFWSSSYFFWFAVYQIENHWVCKVKMPSAKISVLTVCKCCLFIWDTIDHISHTSDQIDFMDQHKE